MIFSLESGSEALELVFGGFDFRIRLGLWRIKFGFWLGHQKVAESFSTVVDIQWRNQDFTVGMTNFVWTKQNRRRRAWRWMIVWYSVRYVAGVDYGGGDGGGLESGEEEEKKRKHEEESVKINDTL